MSTQDNLASQEKIVVNGRHNLCGQRKVYLCILREIGVLTQHCLTVFMVQGFLVQGCVRSSFLVEKVTF